MDVANSRTRRDHPKSQAPVQRYHFVYVREAVVLIRLVSNVVGRKIA